MGYITRFSLSTIKGPVLTDEKEKEIANELAKILYNDTSDHPPLYFDDILEESMKWYECSADMKRISKMYPDYTFLLEGEGEDSGDMWREFFKNGMSKRIKARVVFDDFDESFFRDETIKKVLS
jgi:hypothetical protein